MSQSITQQEPNTYKAILRPYMLVLGLSVIEWSTIRVLSPVLEEKKTHWFNLISRAQNKENGQKKKLDVVVDTPLRYGRLTPDPKSDRETSALLDIYFRTSPLYVCLRSCAIGHCHHLLPHTLASHTIGLCSWHFYWDWPYQVCKTITIARCTIGVGSEE